ncbi:ankyrin [Aspergillus sclerotioniger CBS 115572]|uniref:Ankyrin n=1 Tax=Aspergillus sclerotioniger CBS 115572 TaxID=1450535 RepID=A0A317WZD7_9EURO|nr:ankyrin [Aspergillus sclerotioniger CBS 115572]PWY91746.1 ankyrin [Aspergillus sclerotioniger CBS 115572]
MHDEPTAVLQQLEKEISGALLTGAQGIRFLWVTLQLESISDTERVKDIDSIRKALTSLPPKLSQSYEVIYKRIQSMGEGPRTVAVQSLQWLSCAKRKLSVSGFFAVFSRSSVNSTTVSARCVLDYCCNLVAIDTLADTFRFAHATVREFLETLADYSVHEASTTVSKRCLSTYLWGEYCEDGLLDYATSYWPAHVEQLSVSCQKSGVQKLVTKFFTEEEHLEDWLEHLDERLIEDGFRWSNSLERKLEACFASPPSVLFTVSCFGLFEVLDSPEVIAMIDVNQNNRHDTSGLYLAARWGHVEVVRKLLHLEADVNAPAYQYGSPLQAASFSGHEEIVKTLLDHGATFSPSEKGEYSSPLYAALANGHESIADILLDGGLKFFTQRQFTDALDTASFKGSTKVVERLLNGTAGGFTPNIRPDPLQVTLFGGKTRQAKRLLQECIDVTEERDTLAMPSLPPSLFINLPLRSYLLMPVQNSTLVDVLGSLCGLPQLPINLRSRGTFLGKVLILT